MHLKVGLHMTYVLRIDIHHEWLRMPEVFPLAQSSGSMYSCACRVLQVYRGMLDAARGVYQQQGIRGLYSGLSITLLEIMPYAALQFGLYDLFTTAAEQSRAGTPTADVRFTLPSRFAHA